MKPGNIKSKTVFAVCVSNKGYEASLRLNKLYAVIRDPQAEATGDVRVIDEDGEDYMFEAHCFELIEVPSPLARKLHANQQARTT